MTDLEIYEAYPRHIGRIAALKAIGKAVREMARTMGETLARETIMRATVRFACSEAGQRGQFTPHPATWFNQGRYLDDPQEWNGDASGRLSETRADRNVREAIELMDREEAEGSGGSNRSPGSIC